VCFFNTFKSFPIKKTYEKYFTTLWSFLTWCQELYQHNVFSFDSQGTAYIDFPPKATLELED